MRSGTALPSLGSPPDPGVTMAIPFAPGSRPMKLEIDVHREDVTSSKHLLATIGNRLPQLLPSS
jgi:hypothetical protein